MHSTHSWVYQTEKALDGSGHWGQISSYSGGGYVQNLELTKAKSLAIVDELMQNLWLDRGTRAVFVDFTVYNANINLFCVIRWEKTLLKKLSIDIWNLELFLQNVKMHYGNLQIIV